MDPLSICSKFSDVPQIFVHIQLWFLMSVPDLDGNNNLLLNFISCSLQISQSHVTVSTTTLLVCMFYIAS